MASIDPASCRVALLAGGTSGEREISLASGKGAGEALRTAGFIVDEYDPASKEDLKALIDGDYNVAFLCLHGKVRAAKMVACRDSWRLLAFPTLDRGCGPAPRL